MVDRATSESIIVSLAVLKANWDYKSQAYTETFVPFAAEVLGEASGAVTLGSIQDGIARRYGFRIPQAALKSILQRAARRGLVRRDKHEYIPEAAELKQYDLGPARQQVLRKHEALVDKFVAFCRDRFSRELKREEAEASLLAHIEQRLVPLLRAVVAAAPVAQEPSAFTPDQLDYLVGAFVVELAERDPAGFEYLEAIVKGSMLAAVLYLPEIGSVEHRFTELTVYLDTPFLLEALGYTGPAAESSAKELLELVYQLGARLACFEDTTTEIHGILTAVAAGLRQPGRPLSHVGGVGDYFAQQGMRPSDVELLATRIERDLRSRRIDILPPPPHANELGVDEAVLTKQLREQVRYTRDEALLHDLDALTAVFRIRKAARYSRIENCRAVFVTMNDSLARVARQFFAGRTNDASVPIALLDHELATLAWLKKPLAAPDLPRKQIIADSLSALQPSAEMWKRYIQEVERLQAQGNVSPDDVLLLRYSCEAHESLMEGTLGDPSAMTPRTVADALTAAKAAAAGQALADASLGAREAIELSRREAEAAMRRAAKDEAIRVQTILRRDAASKAASVARFVARAVFAAFALCGAGAMIVAVRPGVLPDWISARFGVPVARWVIAGGGVASTVASVLGWINGTSANSIARASELWASRRVERWFIARLPAELMSEEGAVAADTLPADPAWTMDSAGESGRAAGPGSS